MTNSIARDQITIADNRQRQDFDPEALADLSNSIDSRGLMHPPVMRETSTGLVLVAGERRLRAMETIWLLGNGIRFNGVEYAPNIVPYVTLGELDPLEAEEAELDENLKRKDLTWQEQAAATARLHNLRKAQAEAAHKAPHTVAATALELKGSSEGGIQNDVRQEIIVAQHLHNPEVAKAKTAKEAFKVLKRQEDTRTNAELAARVGKTLSSSSHELFHDNCLDWLRDCNPDRYDVILTDPPYGMGAQSFGDGGGKLANSEHHYDDSYEAWLALLEPLCHELYRVAKQQSHAYLFCDFDRYHELKRMMENAGWYVFRTPLVVYKQDSGRVPLPEHGPRRQYELCLFGNKGKKPVTAIYSDVIPCRLEENIGHGANKPVELYVDLLRRSVRPGDAVLDTFAGTGTIFPAAHQCKVRATGIELSAEYYGISVNRLKKLDEPAS